MAIENLEQVTRNLRRLARVTVPKRFGAFQRALALQAASDLIGATPVDYGVARNGWNASVNTPATGSPNPPPDPTGSQANSRCRAVIATALEFSAIWLGNAVRHAAVLDLGLFIPRDPGPSKDPRAGREGRILVSGGYSVQAPQGMRKGAVANLRRNLAAALRAARAEVPR